MLDRTDRSTQQQGDLIVRPASKQFVIVGSPSVNLRPEHLDAVCDAPGPDGVLGPAKPLGQLSVWHRPQHFILGPRPSLLTRTDPILALPGHRRNGKKLLHAIQAAQLGIATTGFVRRERTPSVARFCSL